MILHELAGGNEAHPVYKKLEASNGARHYGFLQSSIEASLCVGQLHLSTVVIKSLNYHAITCLHSHAGEYRPCEVKVGDYQPPAHYRVQALMDDLVNEVNRNWEKANPVFLATYVLWRVNHIHPFINGNGRTARAASYFVLCVKLGGLLSGSTILPELLRQERDEYIATLKAVDHHLEKADELNLEPLHTVVEKLVQKQLASARENP